MLVFYSPCACERNTNASLLQLIHHFGGSGCCHSADSTSARTAKRNLWQHRMVEREKWELSFGALKGLHPTFHTVASCAPTAPVLCRLSGLSRDRSRLAAFSAQRPAFHGSLCAQKKKKVSLFIQMNREGTARAHAAVPPPSTKRAQG